MDIVGLSSTLIYLIFIITIENGADVHTRYVGGEVALH